MNNNENTISEMKFTVSSSALLSLLATNGKVISNKSSIPILEYFLMELKDGQLTVTTSDLENQDAAEFFNELADWAYANGEAMLIDDEPEKQDGEEE